MNAFRGMVSVKIAIMKQRRVVVTGMGAVSPLGFLVVITSFSYVLLGWCDRNTSAALFRGSASGVTRTTGGGGLRVVGPRYDRLRAARFYSRSRQCYEDCLTVAGARFRSGFDRLAQLRRS
jgi:hypothetical protein